MSAGVLWVKKNPPTKNPGTHQALATRKCSEWDWQCLGAREMRPAEVAEFKAWESAP